MTLNSFQMLIFINAHEENACFAFAWHKELAQSLKEYMTNGNDVS